MKIDRSKLSNRVNFIVMVGMIILLALFSFVIYLSSTENTFVAGAVSATISWKWHEWIFMPIDNFLEKHWPLE